MSILIVSLAALEKSSLGDIITSSIYITYCISIALVSY